MTTNISCQTTEIIIGSEDWSAWLQTVQIGYQEYSVGSGLYRATGTLNLTFPSNYAGIPSNPEYRFNPTQWQRGQSLSIAVGGAFLPCSGQQLYILTPPQRPAKVINGVARLSIPIGCKLALEYFPPEPNDDFAGITPNTPKDRGAIITAVLAKLGIGNVSVSIPEYAIAYPLPKLEGNWLEFCGKLADSAGYYLRCNTAGTIVAERQLPTSSIAANYTIGVDESDWQPIGDVSEQQVEKLIVTGVNYKVEVKETEETVTTEAAIATIDPDTPFTDGATRVSLRTSSIITTILDTNLGVDGAVSGVVRNTRETIREQLPIVALDPDTPFTDGFTRISLRLGRIQTTDFTLDDSGNVTRTVFRTQDAIAKIDPDTPFTDGATRIALATSEITTTEWEKTGERQWTKTTAKQLPVIKLDADTPFTDGFTRIALRDGGTEVDEFDTVGPPQNIGFNQFALEEEQLKSEVIAAQPASGLTRERQKTISVPFAVSQAQLSEYGRRFNHYLNGRAFGWRFATRLNTSLLPFQRVSITEGTTGYILYADAMQWAVSQTEALLLFNGIEDGVFNTATPEVITPNVLFPVGLIISTFESAWSSEIFVFEFDVTRFENEWSASINPLEMRVRFENKFSSSLTFSFSRIRFENDWGSSVLFFDFGDLRFENQFSTEINPFVLTSQFENEFSSSINIFEQRVRLTNEWNSSLNIFEMRVRFVNEWSSSVTLVNLWDFNDTTTALWFDPSDGTSITQSGGFIDQINDKSGNARHATATSMARPAIASGIITFDGSNDFLQIASSTAFFNAFHQTGGSIFAVVKTAANVCIVLDNHGTSSGQTGFSFYTDTQLRYFVGRSVSGQPTLSVIGTAPTTSQFNIWEGVSTINTSTTTGTGSVYINGTLSSSATQARLPAITNASQNLVIGRIAGTGLYYAFELLELVLIEGAVTTDIRQRAEGRLAHKHGLTARLPSGHPYKTTPPTV